MKKEINNEIQQLHQSTSRKYLRRMNDSKIECMKKAKRISKDDREGNRKYG